MFVMKEKSLFDNIKVLDPSSPEINKPFESLGFQHYRDRILSVLQYLPFSVGFRIMKDVDKEIEDPNRMWQKGSDRRWRLSYTTYALEYPCHC